MTPYILQTVADDLDQPDDKRALPAQDAGELTYLVSKVCAEYLLEHGVRYATLSDVQAALAGTRSEVERRIQGPYEERKRWEPGRVDPFRHLDQR